MTPLFSTAYLPPIAYMATLCCHPQANIENKETFAKQTYRNRAEIMTSGGVRTLSVPVIRNNHSRTEEVIIDYSERWNIIHLRTIDAAYNASPYYLYYREVLKNIIMTRYERLIDLNWALLQWLLNTLKISCEISYTQDFKKEYPLDFRNTFSPKHPYPTDNFKPYYQVFSDRIPFTANLSIIDLLMNLGPEAIIYLKNIS